MKKLEIFNRMMARAKAGGYNGPDYAQQTGHILNGTNIYALIFREDFAKAIWSPDARTFKSEFKYQIDDVVYVKTLHNHNHHLMAFIYEVDKWKYLEENAI